MSPLLFLLCVVPLLLILRIDILEFDKIKVKKKIKTEFVRKYKRKIRLFLIFKLNEEKHKP